MMHRPPQTAEKGTCPTGLGQQIGRGTLALALLANAAYDLATFLPAGTLPAAPLLIAAATLLPVGILWCVCNLLWGNGFGDAGLVRGGILGLKRLGWAAVVCAALYLLRTAAG